MSDKDLTRCCFDLDLSLRNGEKHDINGARLISESKILRHEIPKEFTKSIEC